MSPVGVLALAFLAVASAAPRNAPFIQTLTKEQADRLASWDRSTSKQNIWELSGQFEGDMILTPGQRNGLIDTRYRWQNAVIPYELDSIFSASQANQINQALTAFAASSCVTVRPRTSGDTDYVYVTGDNSGCWSYVGRLGGRQSLNLQTNGCVWDDIIVHEFLHAAGFYHQQSATERDDHVAIMWGNIISGMQHNFDKFGADVITSFGQPYDYFSIMHYTAYAFTANGQPTIVPHDVSLLNVIGTANAMSNIDIVKLNLMYCQ